MTTKTPPFEQWNKTLSVAGEILFFGAIAVYSIEDYKVQWIAWISLFLLFCGKVNQDKNSFPESFRQLLKKKKEGTASEQDLENINHITRAFFTWRVLRDYAMNYWVGFTCFILLTGYLIISTPWTNIAKIIITLTQ